jgi:pre-mRNA-splicing factor ATP-dependent RNA helicase DHX15/PRP43
MICIVTLHRRPDRLLEYAPMYFDLKNWPDGETKRALVRATNKREGKFGARFGEGAMPGEGTVKKRKKNKLQ